MNRETHVITEDELREIFPNDGVVHLVMPHYNGKHDLVRAYTSIMERTNYPFVMTIIDDGSSKDDPGYLFMQSLKEHRPKNINLVFNSENVGVTPNLNYGFFLYPKLHCVRLDADIEIQSLHWLGEMARFMYHNPTVGVCGPVGVETDFVTIQTAGQWIVISPEDNKNLPSHPAEVFDKNGQPRFVLPATPFQVDSVLGCCAFYRREMIDKLGGVDEHYFGWVEDNDFCVGVRSLGFDCVILPHIAYCHHHHGGKRSYEETRAILSKSEQRFIEKWGFSLYDPAPYWDEILKRHTGTRILWRYHA